MSNIFKFELGAKARCIVTGLEGIIIGRAQYLNGCKQYGIKQKVGKDGKVPEAHWIDEAQLKQVTGGIKIKREEEPGGPIPDAPRA